LKKLGEFRNTSTNKLSREKVTDKCGADVLSWQYPNTMDAVKSPEYDDVRVVDFRPVAGMISGSAAKIISLSALVLGIWSLVEYKQQQSDGGHWVYSLAVGTFLLIVAYFFFALVHDKKVGIKGARKGYHQLAWVTRGT
jgi:hypothetical protein